MCSTKRGSGNGTGSGSVEQLAERMVATGVTTAADIEWFLGASAEPGFYYLPADGQRVGPARRAGSSRLGDRRTHLGPGA